MRFSPFDHRPQRELGEAIRAALGPWDDCRAFIERVMAEARHASVGLGTWWDVLGTWARPGVAAAALVALLGALSIAVGYGRSEDSADVATVDDALAVEAVAGEPLDLVVSPTPPDVDVVLASVVSR